MSVHGFRKDKKTACILTPNNSLVWTNVAEILTHPVVGFLLQAPGSPLPEQAFALHHQFWSQMLDYSCTLCTEIFMTLVTNGLCGKYYGKTKYLAIVYC